MINISIVNEDGTKITNLPINTLYKKWEKEFPMMDICYEIDKSNIENYTCLTCDKCPRGELFQIPKEDLKIYKEYLNKLNEYNRVHNPKLYELSKNKHNK